MALVVVGINKVDSADGKDDVVHSAEVSQVLVDSGLVFSSQFSEVLFDFKSKHSIIRVLFPIPHEAEHLKLRIFTATKYLF
jgi:hypothetical protein